MKSGERYTYWLLHRNSMRHCVNYLHPKEALLKDGFGCECERCNQARHHAYQALGNAEGQLLKLVILVVPEQELFPKI